MHNEFKLEKNQYKSIWIQENEISVERELTDSEIFDSAENHTSFNCKFKTLS